MTKKLNLNITWRKSSFNSNKPSIRCRCPRLLSLTCRIFFRTKLITRLLVPFSAWEALSDSWRWPAHRVHRLATGEQCRDSKTAWIARWQPESPASSRLREKVSSPAPKPVTTQPIWVQTASSRTPLTWLEKLTSCSSIVAGSTRVSIWTRSCWITTLSTKCSRSYRHWLATSPATSVGRSSSSRSSSMMTMSACVMMTLKGIKLCKTRTNLSRWKNSRVTLLIVHCVLMTSRKSRVAPAPTESPTSSKVQICTPSTWERITGDRTQTRQVAVQLSTSSCRRRTNKWRSKALKRTYGTKSPRRASLISSSTSTQQVPRRLRTTASEVLSLRLAWMPYSTRKEPRTSLQLASWLATPSGEVKSTSTLRRLENTWPELTSSRMSSTSVRTKTSHWSSTSGSVKRKWPS